MKEIVDVNEVKLIKGGSFSDERGMLQFVNDFDFQGVKRFYQLIHHDTEVVRAWQGHKLEHKWFYVAQGSFVMAWLQPDNWDSPSATLHANSAILTSVAPSILSIPPGYVNGIKALEKHSILIVFSNFTVKQSSGDRWSFDANLWMDWSKFN
jgi:dTDP-4-dehydrorhamnose 3,5-epimerase-like enzyme